MSNGADIFTLPRVKNLEELNAKLLAKCTQYLNHQIEGRPDKVGVMLEEDRAALQPMPRYTPDISKKVYPRVGRYSTVLFETNQVLLNRLVILPDSLVFHQSK